MTDTDMIGMVVAVNDNPNGRNPMSRTSWRIAALASIAITLLVAVATTHTGSAYADNNRDGYLTRHIPDAGCDADGVWWSFVYYTGDQDNNRVTVDVNGNRVHIGSFATESFGWLPLTGPSTVVVAVDANVNDGPADRYDWSRTLNDCGPAATTTTDVTTTTTTVAVTSPPTVPPAPPTTEATPSSTSTSPSTTVPPAPSSPPSSTDPTTPPTSSSPSTSSPATSVPSSTVATTLTVPTSSSPTASTSTTSPPLDEPQRCPTNPNEPINGDCDPEPCPAGSNPAYVGFEPICVPVCPPDVDGVVDYIGAVPYCKPNCPTGEHVEINDDGAYVCVTPERATVSTVAQSLPVTGIDPTSGMFWIGVALLLASGVCMWLARRPENA